MLRRQIPWSAGRVFFFVSIIANPGGTLKLGAQRVEAMFWKLAAKRISMKCSFATIWQVCAIGVARCRSRLVVVPGAAARKHHGTASTSSVFTPRADCVPAHYEYV